MVETPLGKAGLVSIPQYVTWRDYNFSFDYLATYDLGDPALAS